MSVTTFPESRYFSLKKILGIVVLFFIVIQSYGQAGVLHHFTFSAIGTTQTAGIPINGITITAVDINNARVTSFVGTVDISSTGTLSAGSGTTGNFVAGVLSNYSVTFSSPGGPYVITATVTGGTAKGNSVNILVNPGLDHFLISPINSPQTAGIAITGISITAMDINNTKVSTYTGTVTISSTGNLTGGGGNTPGFTAGQLNNYSVTISNPGTFNIKATRTLGGAESGTSNDFVVNPSVDHFDISYIASPQTAGVPITGVTITAKDVTGNVVTGFTGNVTYGGSAGVAGSSSNFAAGVLTGVTIIPRIAGPNMTFTVSGAAGRTGTVSFNVDPGPLTNFTFAGISNQQVVGIPATGITLTARDAFANVVTSYFGTVNFTGTAFILQGLPSSSFIAGILTGVTVTPTIVGTNRTFVVTTPAGVTPVASSSFTMNVNPLVDHFVVTGLPATATAGTAIPGIVVTAMASNNVPIPNYTGNVTLGGTAGVTGNSPNFNAGTSPQFAITPRFAGLGMTFTVSGSGITNSYSLDVNHGLLDHFSISPIISPQTAGVAITGITLTAQDLNGNTVRTFNSTVVFGGTAGIAGTSVAFVQGVLAGLTVVPTLAGTSKTFTVTGSGKTGSATFNVNSGLLDHFTITGITSPQTAGTAISGVVITAQDMYGGTVTSYTGNVSYSGSAGINGVSQAFTAGILAPTDLIPTLTGSNLTIIVTDAGKTGSFTFDVDNPIPVLAAISPTSICGGGLDFNVTITGSNFSANSVVQVNGFPRTTVYVNPGELIATITSTDIITAGTPNITVFNPTPAGGTSEPIVFTVNAVPTVAAIAGSSSVCEGTTVTLTNPTPGGVWSSSDDLKATISVGGIVTCKATGVVTISYTVANGTGCKTIVTQDLSINQNLPAKVAITASPTGAVCAGTTVAFTANPTNGGSAATYQWKVNGQNVGTGGSSYAYIPLNKDAVTCVMSSNATCATGNPALSNTESMTVNPNLTAGVSITAVPTGNICAGTAVTFTAAPTNGGTAPTYQWYNGGTPIGGATSATYTSTTLANGDAITVEMTSNATSCLTGSPANSNAVTMSVSPNLTPSVTIAVVPSGTICAGTSVVFTATPVNGGTTPLYQWYKGALPIAGETNSTFTSSTLIDGNNISVRMTSSETCTTGNLVSSNNVIMKVIPVLTLSSSLTPPAVCSGSVFNYLPDSNSLPPGTITYSWKRDAVGGIDNPPSNGPNNPNETLTNSTSLPIPVKYTYTLYAGGCSNDQIVTVIVKPTPVLTSTLNPPAICTNSVFSYYPTSSIFGSTFAWNRAAVAGNPASSSLGNVNEPLVNLTTSPITLTYDFTVTANGCANLVTSSVNVTVNPLPTLTSDLAPASICSGSAFTYTPTSLASGASFTWRRIDQAGIISNDAGKGTGNVSETLINTTTSPIQVTYSFTVSANNCSNPKVFDVKVFVNPSMSLTSSLTPPTVCSGTPFAYHPISSTNLATFSWSRGVTAGISNAAASNNGDISETLNNSTALPVVVTYTYKLSLGVCTNTFDVLVTVNPTPVLTSSLTPPDICSNTVFSYVPLSSSPNATFTWSRAPVPGISNASGIGTGNPNETLINTTTSPIPVNYIFKVSSGGCANPATYTVTVVVNSTVSLTTPLKPLPICSGDIFNYNPVASPSGAVLTWARTAVSGIVPASSQGSGSIGEVLTNTTPFPIDVTYKYTLTTNGCANVQNVVVTVNPSPVLTSGLSLITCSGTNFQYSPTSQTPGTTFTWNRGGVPGIQGTSSGAGNVNELLTVTTNTTAPINVTYVYTLTANGCTNTQDVVVAVNPTPLTPTITPSGPLTFCDGSYVDLTATPVGYNYQWSNGAITQTLRVTTGGSFSVFIKDDFGCKSANSTPITTKTLVAPNAPTGGVDVTACDPPAQNLVPTAKAPNNARIEWFDVPTGGTVNTTPALKTIGTQKFYAESVDLTTGCRSLTRTVVTLTITAHPAAPTASDITACETGAQTILTAVATVPFPQTIKWYSLPAGGASVNNPTLTGVGSVSYYAEADNGICTSSTRTKVTLTINKVPATPTASGTLTKCAEATIVPIYAHASTTEPNCVVRWFTSPSGGTPITLAAGAEPSLSKIGTVTYYAEAYNTVTGCSSLTRSAPVTLTINETPENPTVVAPKDCEKNPIVLLRATGTSPRATVKWYDAATGGSEILNPTLNQVGSVTYYAEASIVACLSVARTPATLRIDPAPVAPVTDNPRVYECDTTKTLTATVTAPPAGVDIQWFTDSIGGNPVAIPVLTSVGSITYYAESRNTSTDCRSLTRTSVRLTKFNLKAPIPNNPSSTNPKEGLVTECAQTSLQTLTASVKSPPTGVSLKWYNSDSGGTEVTDPTLNNIGTVSYYAEYDNGYCVSPRTKVTLKITAPPAAPLINPKTPLTKCASNPIEAFDAGSVIVIPQGGLIVRWYNAIDSDTPLDHSPTWKEIGSSPAYFAEAFDSVTHCRSLTRTQVILTNNPFPADPQLKGNGILTGCELSLGILDLKAADALILPTDSATISWYKDPTGGTALPLNPAPHLNYVGTIDYYAESKLGSCVSANRAKVTLLIQPAPYAPVLKAKTADVKSCWPTPIDAESAILPVSGVYFRWFKDPTGTTEVSKMQTDITSPIGGSLTQGRFVYAEARDILTDCPSLTRTKINLIIYEAPPSPVLDPAYILPACPQIPLPTLDANKSIAPVAGMKLIWYKTPLGVFPTDTIKNPTWNKLNGSKTYYAAFVNILTNCETEIAKRTPVTLSFTSNQASASSNSPVSIGQDLNLIGAPLAPAGSTFTYLWSDPNKATYNTMNVTIPNTTTAMAGRYILTVTDQNGCTSTDTTLVNIYTAKADYQAPCMGGTLYLNALPNNVNYLWSGPGGFTSSDQNPFVNSVTANTAGIYRLRITDQMGAVSTDSVNVVIKPLPKPTIDVTTVCPSGNFKLVGNPGGMVSYSWTNSAGASVDSIRNPSKTFPYTNPLETYTLTVMASNGCDAAISVTPAPFKPKASSNSPLCAGDTLRLRGEPSGLASYIWSDPGGKVVSTLQSPILRNVTVQGLYTLTVRDKAGCTFSDTTTVVLNNPPVTPTIVITPNPVCEGQSVTLQGNPQGMALYEWKGPNGFVSSQQNPVILKVTAADAGLYSLKVTAGCASNAVPVNLSVDGVTFNGTYGPYCKTDSKVTFSVQQKGVIFSGPGVSNGNTFDPAVAGVGIHNVGYTYTSVNCTINSSIAIEVFDKPSVVTNPIVLKSCTGSFGDLTLPAVTVGSSPGLVLSYWLNAAGTQSVKDPKAVGTGLYFIKGATKSGKCWDIQPVNVGQPDSLLANITVSPPSKCAGDSTGRMQVNVTLGTAPFTYLWSTKPVQNTDTITHLRAGIYTVVVTDAKLCTASFTAEITEPAPIKMGFSILPIQCMSDINGTARVDTINGSVDPKVLNYYKYSWATKPVQKSREAVRLPAYWTKLTLTDTIKGCTKVDSVYIHVKDTLRPKIICPKDVEMIVQYTKSTDGSPNKYVVKLGRPVVSDNCEIDTAKNLTNNAPVKFRNGITYVRWTVTDQVGLRDTCTQTVTIKEIPTVPQLMSPNGDGVNDTFVIDGLAQFPNTQMLIYTRSGQLVYRNDNYDLLADEESWNGRYSETTFLKNKLVAPGIYYYVLRLGGANAQALKGYVYVYY